MRRILMTVLFVSVPIAMFAHEPAHLSGLRIQPTQQASHFIFLLSKKTFGTARYAANPARVVINFANTNKDFSLTNAQIIDPNVSRITAEQKPGHILQCTFYLKNPVHWSLQFLNSSNTDLARLEFILNPNHATLTPLAMALNAKEQLKNEVLQNFATFSTELTNKQFAAEDRVVRSRLQQQQTTSTAVKTHIFTVVIDAGHGGKDPGAIGVRGTKEKNIVLSIAAKLAAEINLQPSMRAVLTRAGDYFVPLRTRLKLARKSNADVFVAIHADAYANDNALGASVFALSQRGATSEAARWLAQSDNNSELGGVELGSLPDQDPVLRSVLVDLAQTATIQESIRLGNMILDNLEVISSLHYSHVERAPFVVLKSPDIPSILVETGFISNPNEEARLSTMAYQEQVAHALYLGISRYVKGSST